MDGFQIGQFKVHRIEEWQGRFSLPEGLLQGFEQTRYDQREAEFVPDFVRDGMIYGFLQSWLIEANGARILYDTGAGNDKERPGIPMFGNLRSDFLDRLSAAGFAPDDIDIVICSHLHIDHVGWNTVRRDGKWVPTFANARYLFPAIDRDFWDPADAAAYGRARGAEVNRGVFEDSVQPILDAGLAELVSDGYRVGPGLTLHGAPGHTPGHLFLRAESDGEVALFVGDILHHPMQVHEPTWNSVFCEDQEQARATRRRVLEQAADEHARLVPAHFGGRHWVWIERDGAGFRPIYEDAPAERSPAMHDAS